MPKTDVGALTEGSILGPLFRLAIPFAVGNVLSLVTLTVDRIWVGRVGTDALAALGTAHVALMIMMTLSMGMAVGTLAGVAKFIGAGDRDQAARFFGQGMLIAIVAGGVFAIGAIWLPEWILAFMDTEPEVAAPATTYLRISMVGLAVYAPFQTLGFALQGAGEAQTSMRLAAIAPVVNAILDPIFIFGLELGLPGAAWATVASSTVALAAGLWILRRGDLALAPARESFRLRYAVVRRVFAVGVPGTLEHLVRTVAAFALVKLLTDFGAVVLSAYTTVLVLLMMLIFPGLAVGQATASLVGQNLGAGRPLRAWRTAWMAAGIYALFMVIVGGLMWTFAATLVGIFDPNPAVMLEGQRMLRIVVLCFPFIAVALVLGRAFGGAGKTLPSMSVAAIAHLLFQLPAVYVWGRAHGPTGAYWGMAGAFMLHGALAALVFAWKFRPTVLQRMTLPTNHPEVTKKETA